MNPALIYKLKSWFSDKTIDIESINKQIVMKESKIIELSSSRDKLAERLYALYAFWLTYPPDWERRRSEVYTRTNYCDECGSINGALHVHHIIPISKGGSHAIDNLALLCEECHSKIHGGRGFSYSDAVIIGAFGKRVQLLQSAIQGQNIVHFQYTKYDGQRSVRSIMPEGLKQVGESLCVFGYCFLRNADRFFAIKRMKGTEIVHAPGKCYDR